MTSLRFWCCACIAWIYALGRAAHPDALLAITPPITDAALMLIVAMIAFRPLQRLAAVWLIALPASAALALRAAAGYPLFGELWAGTLTDCGALVATAFLAVPIGRTLEEFRRTVAGDMFRRLRSRPQRFNRAQGAMYQEIRRARTRRQPLVVLTVSPDLANVQASMDRLIEEVQRSMVRDLALARLGELLRKQISSSNPVARVEDSYVILLPDTSREDASELAERLRSLAKQTLGLELTVGRACFPDEEVTLVGLLESARADLHSQRSHRNRFPDRRSESGQDGPSQQAAHGAVADSRVDGESRNGSGGAS